MSDAQQAYFNATLKACRMAFALRKEYAREKTEQLRDKHLEAAASLRKSAQLSGEVVERQNRDMEQRYGTDRYSSDTRTYMMGDDVKFFPGPEHYKELEQRHMDMAAAFDEILSDNKNRRLYPDNSGGTPEAHTKPTENDSISRLYDLRHLSWEQCKAAREILRVYLAITASLHAKIRRMDGAGGGASVEEMAGWLVDLYEGRYKPWTEAMHRDRFVNLPLVIDVVCDGEALDNARRHHRVSYERALEMLQCALEDYALRMVGRRI